MKKIHDILKHLRKMRKAGAGPAKIAQRLGVSEYVVRELLSGRELPATNLGQTRETEQVTDDSADAR